MRWFRSAIIGVIAFVSHARAQTTEQIRAWIEQTIAQAAAFEPPTPVRAEWRSSVRAMPDSVLAEWRKTVMQYPAHPLRAVLADQEARVKRGHPDTITYTLWYASRQLWRTAVNQSNLDVLYDDKGTDGRIDWTLNARALEMTDAGAQGPLGGQLAIGFVRKFVSQGLVPYLGPGVELANFRASSSEASWTAAFELPDGATATLRGEWREAVSLREVEVRMRGDTRYKLRIVVGGIVYDPVLAVVRATTLEVKSPTSDVISEWVGSTSIPRQDVSLRAAPPDPTGTDAVRGAVTVVQVNDLRQNSREVRFKEGEQWRTITVAQAADGYTGLRMAGWVIAAIIIVVLVGLRVRSLRAPSDLK